MHSFLVSFAIISYYNGKILLYTTLWMPAVQFLIAHVGCHGLFFVILTNFHSILSEHKAPDDNVNTRLLLWPVNKSQMTARLKCANISYRLLKILHQRKDGQSIFDSSGGQNLEELSIIYNFKFIFSVVNGCSIVFRGSRSALQTPIIPGYSFDFSKRIFVKYF